MLTPSEWQQLVLSTSFMQQLERLADKRFVQPSLAQQAVNVALEKLSEDNWQTLSSFSGRSQPTTFALTVATRLMEDFARQQFGRPRPPQWLQQKGQSWIQIWRMLCLERQWPELIINKLSSVWDNLNIASVIGEIKRQIPRCGEPGFSECRIEEHSEEHGEEPHSADLDDAIAHSQRQQAIDVLSQLLQQTDANSQDCPSDKTFAEFNQRCNLSENDRLLLALSYEDGFSSRKVAELTQQSPSSVQRRLTQIRQTLQQTLAEMGVTL